MPTVDPRKRSATILPHHGVWPTIPASSFVAPTSVIIGEVALGEEASIWFHTVLRGDVDRIRVGARSNIQDNSTVHVTRERWPALIGADVIAGHNVLLHGCVVEDRVLVGMGSIILDGAQVGTESIVAAGTLLPPGTRVPPRSFVRGHPGKVIRPVTDEELESLVLRGVRSYLEYKETYRE